VINTDGLLQKTLTYLIAAVWLINGLFCKILNFVPRHQQIVARILGEDHSFLLTKTIGTLELLMAVWVVSRIQSRLCTVVQILLVASMNIIEFFLAPDLLLLGRFNILIAVFFIGLLILNEMLYSRRQSAPNFSDLNVP